MTKASRREGLGVAAAVRAGQGQPRALRVGGGSHRAAPLEAGATSAGKRVRIAEDQPAIRAGGLRSRQPAAPVIGVDTNVLARTFVAEDEADAATERQRRAAHDRLESGQPLFLAKTVALELEWVLRGYYGFPVEQVLQVFELLLAHPGLTAEDRPALEQAVAGVRNGLDLADDLHHASCRSCASMASFDDRDFVRRIRQLNLAPRLIVPTGS